MSREMEQRRAMLLLRCTAQREQICYEIRSIEAQLDGVQRGIRFVRRLATFPGLLAAGSVLTILAVTGRRRTLQMISTGLALWAAARRLRHGRAQLAELLAPADF